MFFQELKGIGDNDNKVRFQINVSLKMLILNNIKLEIRPIRGQKNVNYLING